jgi:CHAT domain-containing protein
MKLKVLFLFIIIICIRTNAQSNFQVKNSIDSAIYYFNTYQDTIAIRFMQNSEDLLLKSNHEEYPYLDSLLWIYNRYSWYASSIKLIEKIKKLSLVDENKKLYYEILLADAYNEQSQYENAKNSLNKLKTNSELLKSNPYFSETDFNNLYVRCYLQNHEFDKVDSIIRLVKIDTLLVDYLSIYKENWLENHSSVKTKLMKNDFDLQKENNNILRLNHVLFFINANYKIKNFFGDGKDEFYRILGMSVNQKLIRNSITELMMEIPNVLLNNPHKENDTSYLKTMKILENKSEYHGVVKLYYLERLAYRHFSYGNYSECSKLYNKIFNHLLGDNHMNTHRIFKTYVYYLKYNGQYKEAIDIMKRSLVYFLKNNLYGPYYISGNYLHIGQTYGHIAVWDSVDVYGYKYLDYINQNKINGYKASAYHSLTFAKYNQFKFKDADSLINLALQIAGCSISSETSNVYDGQHYYLKGMILSALNNAEEAIRWYKKSYYHFHRLLGNEHRDLLFSLPHIIIHYTKHYDPDSLIKWSIETHRLFKINLYNNLQNQSDYDIETFKKNYDAQLNDIIISLNLAYNKAKHPTIKSLMIMMINLSNGFTFNQLQKDMSSNISDKNKLDSLNLLLYKAVTNKNYDLVKNYEDQIHHSQRSINILRSNSEQLNNFVAPQIQYYEFSNTGLRYYTEKLYLCVIQNEKDTIITSLDIQKESELFFEIKSHYTLRGKEDKFKTQTSYLYDKLIAPIWPYLQNYKTMTCKTWGIFSNINLNTIAVNDKEILSDKIYIRYQSGDKLESDQFKPNISFAIGDIQYDLKENTNINVQRDSFLKFLNRSLINNSWSPLPNALEEVENISNVIIKNKIKHTLLTNIEAGEKKIKQLFSYKEGKKIIHFATHGFYFKNDQIKNVESPNGFITSPNPLMRSGLILAGANYTWKFGVRPCEDCEDGILTSYELMQYDLSDVELMVLSACETGIGDLSETEGVIGLQRALRLAGVKRQLVSLWQVPDFSSKELMVLFYKNWLNKRQAPHIALANAQKMVRKKYPEPIHWAGWVLLE